MSTELTGVNNNLWFDDSQGLWDSSTGKPAADPIAKLERTGSNLVRYPGGTPANLFDWKAAIGPQSQRGCQLDGRNAGGKPRDSRYGPDEHMALVKEMNAQASIMTPFAEETAADAADWVEYMNAPVGSNPRGGTAWAAVRAANGHPEPYNVKIWEIGNELHFLVERYWMSQDNETAAEQYINGGTQERTDRVRRDCDNRPAASISTGTASQHFQVLYPPVIKNSQTITVDDVKWTEVADLGSAGPNDRVYSFDNRTGKINFGDGVHGAIPADGARIGSHYVSGPHPGFLDFYREMKAVDPSIDVLATWAPVTAQTGRYLDSFPERMAREGHAGDYDGVTIHPYTDFARDFDTSWATAQEGHDEYFLGEQKALALLDDLRAQVKAYSSAGAYTAVSEFGALWFQPGAADIDSYPTWSNSMSHATYMAAQWAHFAQRGMPWAIGNTTTAPGLRAMLGEQPDFVYSGDALARQLLRPMVDQGGSVLNTFVDDNPLINAVAPNQGSYQQLISTSALGQDGRLRILVINTSATSAITANVNPVSYRHAGRIDVSVVKGRDGFTDENTVNDPDAIMLTTNQENVGAGAFAHSFPAASVTVITMNR